MGHRRIGSSAEARWAGSAALPQSQRGFRESGGGGGEMLLLSARLGREQVLRRASVDYLCSVPQICVRFALSGVLGNADLASFLLFVPLNKQNTVRHLRGQIL